MLFLLGSDPMTPFLPKKAIMWTSSVILRYLQPRHRGNVSLTAKLQKRLRVGCRSFSQLLHLLGVSPARLVHKYPALLEQLSQRIHLLSRRRRQPHLGAPQVTSVRLLLPT